MISIECSGCGARGEIDEAKCPPGVSSVRCRKCGTSIPLFTAAPQPLSAETDPQPDTPAPVTDPPPDRQESPRVDSAPEPGVCCAVCGGSFPEPEVARFGADAVCGGCKPAYIQFLQQGKTVAGLRYGGFWIRVAAKMLDGVILGLANMLISFLGIGIIFGSGGDSAGIALMIIQWLVQMGIAVGYTVYFLGTHGATPGKMACGLRVIRPDGDGISYQRALGRHFAELLSSLIMGIGYIMAAFDEEKRALHDRICDTRVVYK